MIAAKRNCKLLNLFQKLTTATHARDYVDHEQRAYGVLIMSIHVSLFASSSILIVVSICTISALTKERVSIPFGMIVNQNIKGFLSSVLADQIWRTYGKEAIQAMDYH
jgi:hypothetical protein